MLLWSFDANSPLVSSPTIGPDGTVYVGAMDGKCYAVAADGHLRWTFSTDGTVYSSPAVSPDGNQIYVGSQDGLLYALGRDGSELWSFETQGPGSLLHGAIHGSPAVAEDGTVLFGAVYDANLYALEPNGLLKWQCTFDSNGWPFASPVVADNNVVYQVLLNDANLYAIDAADGNILWKVDLADPCSGYFGPDYEFSYGKYADGWSEPVLGPDGTIYVNLDDPYIRALDPSGTIKWVSRIGSMGGFTMTVGADGLIYAACDDGYLSVLDTDGEELARLKVDDQLNYPVVAADGTLIVAGGQDRSHYNEPANNTVWAIKGYGCAGKQLVLHRPGDTNADGIWNLEEYVLVAEHWGECTDTSPYPPDYEPRCDYEGTAIYFEGDLNRDLYVDANDLLMVAEQWLLSY